MTYFEKAEIAGGVNNPFEISSLTSHMSQQSSEAQTHRENERKAKEAKNEADRKAVMDGLRKTLEIAKKAGIKPEKIMLDPGVGFAKDADQNLSVIKKHELNLNEKIDELVKTALETRETIIVSAEEE